MIEPSRALSQQELNVLMHDPAIAGWAKDLDARAEEAKSIERRQLLLPPPKLLGAVPK